MTQSKRTGRRNRAGLTLMEVMLVLVILGILGSMAAVFLRGAQQQALIKTVKTELSIFKTGCEAYQMNMFSYPQDSDGLRALLQAPSSNSEKWTGPYIEPNDLQDPWGNEYQYKLLSQNQIQISSAGPDGQHGSEDDIRLNDQQQ